MPLSHHASLRLRPDISELKRLVSFVDAFAAETGIAPTDATALMLAAEELFANTVHHGESRGESESVHLELWLDEGALIARYSDEGIAFDTTHASPGAAADVETPIQERRPGGLGLHLLSKMMQRVSYEREGQRNVTSMTRALDGTRLASHDRA